MDNITSYIGWYSDFDFIDMPFNIVDSIILCQLAYAQFDLNSLKEAPLRDCLIVSQERSSTFQREAIKSKRFGNIIVSDIFEAYDEDYNNPTQFYAICFTYQPNHKYIAFRGTDASLAGWKEDLMMGYQKITAHDLALEYLKRCISKDCRYVIGGHSKGANLALYACSFLPDDKLKQVEHIYLNDGPGLNPAIYDVSVLERIDEKATVLEPEFSIFGKIYEPQIQDIRIVKSTQQGLLQHSMSTWIIDKGHLKYTSSHTDTSTWVNMVINNWFESESLESRKIFADELFQTLTSTGAKTRYQIKPGNVDDLKKYWKAISTSDTKAKLIAGNLPLSAIFGNFFREINTGNIYKAVHDSITIQGILCLLIGLFMLLLPRKFFDIAFVILLFSVVIIQIVNVVNMLIRYKRHLRSIIPQVIICSASFAIFLILLVKESALFIIESAVIGFVLLVWSFRNWIHTKESVFHSFEYWKNIAETFFTLLFGMFILVAPSYTISSFTTYLGYYMLFDGIITAITGKN